MNRLWTLAVSKLKAAAIRYPWRTRGFIYTVVNGAYMWLVENEIIPVQEHWESTLETGLALLTFVGLIKVGERATTPVNDPRLPPPTTLPGAPV